MPLEAQRLGLESYASDLNPVAVLINKAMIEIPPKFAGKPPVNPEARADKKLFARGWRAQGLAEDVRYYGRWMRDEAEKRIGHLYPKVEVTAEMVKERPDLKPYLGRKLTVIAWIWARTVKSPNPAFAQVDVPLASTFVLSTKAGKEAYVEPVIENGGYRFTVKVGKPKDAAATKAGTKLSRGANFECLMSGTPIGGRLHQGRGHGRSNARALMADRRRGRPRAGLHGPDAGARGFGARKQSRSGSRKPLAGGYAQSHISDAALRLDQLRRPLHPRQLVRLTTFSDLVGEAREHSRRQSRRRPTRRRAPCARRHRGDRLTRRGWRCI